MRIHFIAIGGSVMCDLAIALDQKGYEITGSDDAIFHPLKARLAAHSLLPKELGWFPEKISTDLDAIILGTYAKKDNPELLKAQILGIKALSYPEFLYEQSKYKTRVVIGGSYGKTTITAMILHVMNYHQIEVDYVIGKQLNDFDTTVQLTEKNDFIILEGDEHPLSAIDSRPKFHIYKPNIALLSGIVWDRVNTFPNYENYVEKFNVFVNQIITGGTISYNAEDLKLVKVVEASENQIRKLPYKTPEYFVDNGRTFIETPEGNMPVEIFGKHNLNNLAGTQWICQQMGVQETEFYEAIASFKEV